MAISMSVCMALGRSENPGVPLSFCGHNLNRSNYVVTVTTVYINEDETSKHTLLFYQVES